MASDPKEAPRGPFGGRTISLGRLFGIKVGIDPSWFIIFVLVTATLGSSFEEDHESWGFAMAWSAGLIASLLYFLSILAHELGHSVTSKLLGLPVISITLFLFGGVAQLSGEPSRPRDAFLIAIAGPGVSALLALFFLVLALATDDGTVIGEVAGWLGGMNLALLIFNMIPGFPLDGGHVFRAMLWAALDDRDKATRWAGMVGALFARFLIGAGLAIAIFGGVGVLGAGLFMAFVGWFLLRAARASVWQATVKLRLEGVRVGQAMGERASIDVWSTVEDVAEGLLTRAGQATVLVEDEGRLVGFVRASDVQAIPEEKRAFHRVTEVMTSIEGGVTIGPRETLFSALETMQSAGRDHLLVVHEGETIGVLSREQISSVLQNRTASKR